MNTTYMKEMDKLLHLYLYVDNFRAQFNFNCLFTGRSITCLAWKQNKSPQFCNIMCSEMTRQVALLHKPSSNVKMTIRGMYPHDLYGNRAHKARFLSTRLLHNDQKQQGIPKMCLTCFVPGIIMKAVWEWATGDKGPAFNIKLSSYQYRNSHCGDNTSSGRLISTILIPVLVRRLFYI